MLFATSFLFPLLFLFNSAFITAFARRYPCDNLLARKEWRNMMNTEKSDYITAVKCLQSRPSRTPAYPKAVSRFDEFQAHYMKQADNFQYLGQFLPWHRQFLRSYEKALRKECGYKGATPYWDWSQDADSNSSISAAPVFNSTTGFGGDGTIGTFTLPTGNLTMNNKLLPSAYRGCVRTGPFTNYTLNVGPGKQTIHHCLTRGITDTTKKTLNSTSVVSLSKAPGFETFRVQIQTLFDGGRTAVGGEMSNILSGAGDPLFYLHIANLDRIWWNWQLQAPATRFFSVSGPASKALPYMKSASTMSFIWAAWGLTFPFATS